MVPNKTRPAARAIEGVVLEGEIGRADALIFHPAEVIYVVEHVTAENISIAHKVINSHFGIVDDVILPNIVAIKTVVKSSVVSAVHHLIARHPRIESFVLNCRAIIRVDIIAVSQERMKGLNSGLPGVVAQQGPTGDAIFANFHRYRSRE